MMGLDLLLLDRAGTARRLTARGRAGYIDLPRVSDELYHSARVLRVFTMQRREMAAGPLVDLLSQPQAELEERLGRGEALV